MQLTIAINFISSKTNDEERVMHSESDNIEIMINDKTDEIIEKFFESLLTRYQTGSETSMRGSDFIIKSLKTERITKIKRVIDK